MSKALETIKTAIESYANDETDRDIRLDEILQATSGLGPLEQAEVINLLTTKQMKGLHGFVKADLQKAIRVIAREDKWSRHPETDFYFDEDGKSFLPVVMANELRQDMQFMKIYGEKETRLYQHGVYHLDRSAKIERAIETKMEKIYQPRYSSETLKVIDTRYRVASHEDVYHPETINFRNGYLKIKSGKFVPHAKDPSFQSIVQMPFDYDPDKTCPNFDAFLSDIQPEEEQRKLIYQAFACSLYQGVPPLSMFIWMFVGETHTGKSTTLDILTAFLGEDHVSNEKIRDLADGENRFSRFQLAGKLANIDADAKVDYLRGDGLLKQISDGSRISIQGKGANATELRLTSTLLIGINKLPQSADTTSGFLKRLMPIRFEQQHEGTDVVHDMVERCTSNAELSGIFNKVYPYLKGLLTGKIRVERSEKEESEVSIFQEDNFNDPIKQFVEYNCDPQVNSLNQTEPDFMIERAYDQFLEDEGVPISKRPSKKMLRKRLREDYNVETVTKEMRIDGKRQRVYGYIGLGLFKTD